MKKNMTKYSFLLLMLFIANLAVGQTEQIVRVTPGYASVVVCPVAPELVTVGNMDAFSVQSAGNYVLIKPLVSSGSTNMFIKAGKDSYNLILQVADQPDMETRLKSTSETLQQLPPDGTNGSHAENGTNGHGASTATAAAGSQSVLMSGTENSSTPKPISSLNTKALAELSSRYKATNRYAHSVNNSNVIFAIDYLKQFKDKLLVIGTIINNSNIPYDIGFVTFNRIDYKSSFVLFRKKN